MDIIYSHMNIQLPPSLENSIVSAVHDGRYPSLDSAMAEAASMLVQHLENERNRAKTVARLAVAISLGTLAWAFVLGFAIFGYSQQITWHGWKNRWDVLLFFAYAFSIAGAITSTVAYVAAGKRKWAIGACASNIVFLAASLPVVHWFIYHKIVPNDRWTAKHVWDYARDSADFAFVLGCSSALIVSGLILAYNVLERHTKRWQFGLIVAMTVAFLGLGVLPWLAYSLHELAELSTAQWRNCTTRRCLLPA